MKNLGGRIREAMKKEGIRSVYRLSKLSGVNYKTINSWFSGQAKRPTMEHMEAVARILGVNAIWLLHGNKEHEPTLHDDILLLAQKIEQFTKKYPYRLEHLKKLMEFCMTEEEKLFEQHKRIILKSG